MIVSAGRYLWATMVLLVGLFASPRTSAQAQSSTHPTTTVVREWAILLSDPFLPRANDPVLFTNALPTFIGSRRTPTVASVNQPAPIGVIRIRSTNAPRVDIRLGAREGTIFATWPVARLRSGNDALWRDISLITEPRSMMPLDSQHWLRLLRRGEGPFLYTADRAEPFLLYDVTLPLSPASPLSVAPGTSENALKVANASHAPLHDVVLYRPDRAGGWQTATIPTLEPDPGASPPTNTPITPAPQPTAVTLQQQQVREQTLRAQINRIELQRQVLAQQGVNIADLQVMLAQLDAQQQSLEQQLQPKLPTTPAINPAAAAERAGVQETALSRAAPLTRDELRNQWKQRLAPYDLLDADLDVIAEILFAELEKSSWLAAVYRLDDAELSRLLPLEITPDSADVRRVGLVVARNIDPRTPAAIDALVVQLGHSDWRTREQATRELAALGLAARAKLIGAMSSTDMEVVIRAERLLGAMSGQVTKPTPIDAVGPGIRIAF